MKVTDIPFILDTALELRALGRTYIPMFSGDAGIGKSEIVQGWVKKQQELDPSFGFIDLRLAYFEAPDFIGPVRVTETDDGPKVINLTHSRWPTTGRGLIFLEEPNRCSDPGVINGMYELLTERKINGHRIGDGWILCAAVNPDDGNYDVSNMDTALRDRFEIFNVVYDKKTFVNFMKETGYDDNVISFIDSGQWVFKPLAEIGTEGTYIANRTWSRVDSLFKVNMFDKSPDLFYENLVAKLGKGVASAFYKYVEGSKPLTLADFKGKKKAKALEKLTSQVELRKDLVNQTLASLLQSFEESGKIDHVLVNDIMKVLTGDLVRSFLTDVVNVYHRQLLASGNNCSIDDIKAEIKKTYPDALEMLKARVKGELTKENTDGTTDKQG